MILKISLRNQVKEYLKQQMINGKISFGERISLPSVAKELDVSVTPIREALTQLQQVNIVEAIPNRGFFLPALNKKESAEIYPIIAQLEHLAVSSSTYTTGTIKKLEQIQSNIEKVSTPIEIVLLDIEFHDTLLKDFDNKILKRMLDDLKTRVFLYEFHYMQENDLSALSSNYHRNIIAQLQQKNTDNAADLIKESWLTSIKFIENKFTN